MKIKDFKKMELTTKPILFYCKGDPVRGNIYARENASILGTKGKFDRFLLCSVQHEEN
jgi:hypothetical protein